MAKKSVEAGTKIYFPLLEPNTLRGSIFTRLVKIQPGNPSNIIQCELGIVDLKYRPPYEALSYVWGNPELCVNIICNGHPKSVTSNLGAALRRLRYQDEERTFWIDALCINQENSNERSQQVAYMKEIYSQARRVVVWLGEDDDSSAATALLLIK